VGSSIRTASAIAAANYSGYFTYAARGPVITSFTPTSVCPNVAATITITGTNLGSATEVTLNGEPCTIVSNTATQIVITTDASPQAGNIVVTTAANSATSPSALSLLSLPPATATAASSTTFCQGGSVVINANTGTGLTYQWRNSSGNISGATASSYTTSVGDAFRIIVTNSDGCRDTSVAVNVTVNSLPIATATAGGATTFCQGGNVIINANTGTGLTYQWRNAAGNISGATNAN
ncbi:MAG: IPT/TIG domain-containing protein, partial [Bacteroidota bacterium]